MGRVKSWVMDMEDDVWELEREQCMEKQGISNVLCQPYTQDGNGIFSECILEF